MNGKSKFSCLVLEDDPISARVVCDALDQEGAEVTVCESLQAAREAVEKDHFDLAILDHQLPDGTGSEFFYYLSERRELTICIVLTAFPDLPKAVELTRSGLFDYLTKPFAMHDFQACIRRASLRLRQNELELSYPDYSDDSTSMRHVRQLIKDAANNPQAPVLLYGETGTGKDITARIIHQLTFKKEASSRPFVSLNCSTLPADMFEAELFGAEKGSYTGAHQQRIGLCEAANGGVLFLDEIAEVPLALQAKLLHFLESFEYRRLGSTQSKRFEGRLIAATNKPLADEVAAGRFRKDLMYRLDVMVITLPPLRERKEDLPTLCEVLLKKLAEKYGRPKPAVRQQELDILRRYDFPGNIRELRNILERSLIQTPREQQWLQLDSIWLKKLLEYSPAPAPVMPAGASAHSIPSAPAVVSSAPAAPTSLDPANTGGLLDDQQFALIQQVLIEEKGVIRRAAARLGLTHQSLLRRLEKWPKLREVHKLLQPKPNGSSGTDATASQP